MNDVDIILPTYNCESYIEETIKSIIEQTLKNWKLIIIDDASNDSTVKLIKSYLKDKRITLKILKKNKGQGFCRNLAIRYSTSNYVAFIDSDDIWLANKLKKQTEIQLEFFYIAQKKIQSNFYNYELKIFPLPFPSYKEANSPNLLKQWRGKPVAYFEQINDKQNKTNLDFMNRDWIILKDLISL